MKRTKINWVSVLCWIVYPIAIIVAVAWLMMLTSCATSRTLQEHHVRTIVADMLATQAQQDTHTSNFQLNVDSIINVVTGHVINETAAQEHSQEQITETVITTTDSLGRELRQEQRTILRTLSRQEQQREEQLTHTFEQRLQQAISSQDSLWQMRFQQYQTHVNDSLASQKEQQATTAAAPALTWWQKAWTWLRGILLGVVLAVAAFISRGLWTPLLKKKTN